MQLFLYSSHTLYVDFKICWNIFRHYYLTLRNSFFILSTLVVPSRVPSSSVSEKFGFNLSFVFIVAGPELEFRLRLFLLWSNLIRFRSNKSGLKFPNPLKPISSFSGKQSHPGPSGRYSSDSVKFWRRSRGHLTTHPWLLAVLDQ